MVLQSTRQKNILEFVLLLLIYAMCVALAAALWRQPAKLTGCYVLVTIFTLLKWHATADLVSYATAAVLGPFGEAVAVHYGAWTYAESSFLVPAWLPLLWGFAGFFIRRLTSTIICIQRNRE